MPVPAQGSMLMTRLLTTATAGPTLGATVRGRAVIGDPLGGFPYRDHVAPYFATRVAGEEVADPVPASAAASSAIARQRFFPLGALAAPVVRYYVHNSSMHASDGEVQLKTSVAVRAATFAGQKHRRQEHRRSSSHFT